MLVGGSNEDMNSTDESEKMYGIEYSWSKLSSPENIINSTRGQYNEIDYERRDLGNGKYYKKNPDFIVFFKEFDDIDNIDNIDNNNKEIQQILNDEQMKWQESVKAAKEFGIPIVKINREKCNLIVRDKVTNEFLGFDVNKYLDSISQLIDNKKER